MFIFSNRRSVFRTLISYFSNIHRTIHWMHSLFRENANRLHTAHHNTRQPNNHNGNKKHRKRSDENSGNLGKTHNANKKSDIDLHAYNNRSKHDIRIQSMILNIMRFSKAFIILHHRQHTIPIPNNLDSQDV